MFGTTALCGVRGRFEEDNILYIFTSWIFLNFCVNQGYWLGRCTCWSPEEGMGIRLHTTGAAPLSQPQETTRDQAAKRQTRFNLRWNRTHGGAKPVGQLSQPAKCSGRSSESSTSGRPSLGFRSQPRDGVCQGPSTVWKPSSWEGRQLV